MSEADRDAEEAIRALVAASRPRRGRARRGVRRRRRRREVDRRPDRRHDELRARRPGLGDAARARARGRVVERRLVSAPALGRRWWAVRGEGAFADGERVPRLARRRASRTRRSRRRRRARCRPAGRRSRSGRGRTAGFGDFWQHCLVAEGALEVATRPGPERCGTTPRCSSSSRKQAAAAPLRRRRPARRRQLRLDERRAPRRDRLAAGQVTDCYKRKNGTHRAYARDTGRRHRSGGATRCAPHRRTPRPLHPRLLGAQLTRRDHPQGRRPRMGARSRAAELRAGARHRARRAGPGSEAVNFADLVGKLYDYPAPFLGDWYQRYRRGEAQYRLLQARLRRARRPRRPGRARSGRAPSERTSLAFGGAPGGNGAGLPSRSMPSSALALVDLQRDVVAEPRARASRRADAPARACRGRAASRRRDPRPERREQRRASAPCAPTRCPRPRRAVEQLRELAVRAGRSSHSVESTISRSTIADQLLELGGPDRRLAAPAAEHRQVRDQQRQHDRRRRRRAVAAQRELDHLAADRAVADRKAAHRELRVEPVRIVRLRHEQQRARRMALRHPRERLLGGVCHSGGTHAMCVITDVRRFGCAPSSADASRSRASSRSICGDR